jgi:hypothetical protein
MSSANLSDKVDMFGNPFDVHFQFIFDISIRHEPEIKGGLKALQQKGLKITEYKEDIPKPRRR